MLLLVTLLVALHMVQPFDVHPQFSSVMKRIVMVHQEYEDIHGELQTHITTGIFDHHAGPSLCSELLGSCEEPMAIRVPAGGWCGTELAQDVDAIATCRVLRISFSVRDKEGKVSTWTFSGHPAVEIRQKGTPQAFLLFTIPGDPEIPFPMVSFWPDACYEHWMVSEAPYMIGSPEPRYLGSITVQVLQ